MKAEEIIDTQGLRYENKGLIAYLLVTFLIPWGLVLGMYLSGIDYNSQAGLIVIMVALVMPTIGVIAASVLTKSGLNEIGINPNLKGHIVWYLIAWILPAFLIIGGGLVFYLIWPNLYDSGFREITKNLTAQEVPADKVNLILIMSLIKGIVIDPILNIIQTLPGEIGWRGYLLPALTRRLGRTKAIIVSGVIWGIWYAPLIALGSIYGKAYDGYPWLGILAMIIFSIVMGIILSFFTIRVKSVIPAALIYSGIGNFANFPGTFLTGEANMFVGPSVYGIVGGSIMLLMAVLCMVSLQKGKKTEVEPQREKKK